MFVGLPKEILNIGVELKEKGLVPSPELLAAKEIGGRSGLFMALQNGNADAIRAWGRLLQLLPGNQRGALVKDLLAENWSLCRGLTMNTALEAGHADAIRAFKEILKWLPDNERVSAINKLLGGVPISFMSDKVKGLAGALENGCADAIRAWSDLLDLLPDKGRALIKKYMESDLYRGDIPPGLTTAIKNGHVDAISAWLDVLKGFSEADRGSIIKNFVNERLSHLKIQNEPDSQPTAWNAAVIRGVGSLLRGLPDNECRKIIKDMLSETAGEGTPRFFGLFLETNVDTVNAWNTLLKDVLGKELGVFIQGLLAENKKNGSLSVDIALEQGNAGAIRLLEAGLQLIPEAERSTTLQGLFADRMAFKSDVTGLMEALRFGHAEAIKAWISLLEWLPNNERSTLIKDLLAENRYTGRVCLAAALQYGHADAIRAFGRVLQLLPARERSTAVRDLLQEINVSGPMTGLDVALQNGHADAIQVWAGLLQWLPDDERGTMLKDLLATKIGLLPVLYPLLKSGQADVLQALGSVLQLLPDNERGTVLTDFMAAKDVKGVPGLFIALFNGNAGAIQAWGSLLDWLPTNERTAVL
jgi:tetratricopeptide (TPR) repeat protein